MPELPATRVAVHHEGAGAPTNHVERLRPGGYSIGLGIGAFQVWRSPLSSFATGGWNGRTLDVCFSGHRGVHEITDIDVELLRSAVVEARERGWVIAQPEVAPHQQTSATACPGSHVMARWSDVVLACTAEWADLSWLARLSPEQVAFLELLVPMSHSEREQVLRYLASFGQPLPAPLLPLPPPSVSRPTLRIGSRGAAVHELQERLHALTGKPRSVDGVYGTFTAQAVADFQRFFGLWEDAVAGPATWGMLDVLDGGR